MKKILIVEGNTAEENGSFTEAGIKTHTESLRESLEYLSQDLILDVVNPSSDNNINNFNEKLYTYDGLIWGGSSLNIYNDTPEIKKQIEFMKNCQNKVKNILGICWGMQVAVTAAGGQVKKANTSHVGIAKEIEINEYGLKHPLYKDKEKKFNSPAFNYDEVVKIPENGICLASNKINKVQSLYFQINKTRVWGLQYHPEITYEKMISLINFRRKRLIEYRKVFKNENDLENHISFIEKEIQITVKEKKMLELKNWLKELN
tara:strand:- start:226 stop:1008 length:783 start_codon:yes stop_codon:yes gene_type:complete